VGFAQHADGKRKRTSPFPSRSAALTHYHDVIEPQLRGEPTQLPELTLAEFAPLYLERHGATVRPRTIQTLRERLVHATRAFGDVPLRDLERMMGEIASWQVKLPERSRYGIVQALRQALEAAVRWGYTTRNPATLAGRNRQPAPRPIRAYTAGEVEAIAAELSPQYQPLPAFVAATGLRPEEWQALERRDVERRARVLNVLRTVSSGEVVELAKTNGARRQVPLSGRALAEARHAAPVPVEAREAARPRPLPAAAVGTGDRGVRRPPARPHLRPAFNVRLERAGGRRPDPRAGEDHGHERQDDRAALRGAARRSGGRYRIPPRCIRRDPGGRRCGERLGK
jgi:integrase